MKPIDIPYFSLNLPMFGEIFRVGRLGFTGLPGVEILSPEVQHQVFGENSPQSRPLLE